MKRTINKNILIGAALLLLYSCHKSEYAKLEKAELSSGIMQDSLFHEIRFGQSKKQFYEICWNKNKEGLFSAGSFKNYVNYELRSGSSEVGNIEMYFYPQFDEEDRIVAMDLEYKYKSWSPWNESYTVKKLLPALKDTLMHWYGGNKFMKIDGNDEETPIWVKVDGNRRIAIKAKDEERLQVKMVDLTAGK